MSKEKSTKKKTEEFKNSTGLNVIIPKDDSKVNRDRLARVAGLMARTQRI